MGPRFDEMGQACSNGTGNPRFGTPMPEWSHGRERQGPGRPEFQPGCGGTAPTGADRPDRSIALGPPDQRRGKSRDSRMLDWDATARLTPLPARRHVSRAPAPSRPRSRHCAAAGSPSRCAATVSSEYRDSCRIFQIVSFWNHKDHRRYSRSGTRGRNQVHQREDQTRGDRRRHHVFQPAHANGGAYQVRRKLPRLGHAGGDSGDSPEGLSH